MRGLWEGCESTHFDGFGTQNFAFFCVSDNGLIEVIVPFKDSLRLVTKPHSDEKKISSGLTNEIRSATVSQTMPAAIGDGKPGRDAAKFGAGSGCDVVEQ